MTPPDEGMAALYRGLTLGLRDYVDKNGFPGVVLGLSGGIDSRLWQRWRSMGLVRIVSCRDDAVSLHQSGKS